MKGLRIRSYSGPYFLALGLYSVRMREKTDQNNSEYRQFLRSGYLKHQSFSELQITYDPA